MWGVQQAPPGSAMHMRATELRPWSCVLACICPSPMLPQPSHAAIREAQDSPHDQLLAPG